MEPQNELETFLEKSPTLNDVLSSPALSKTFYWFLVSRFAIESLLFHEAVSSYRNAVRAGNVDRASELRKKIVTEYLGPDSAFEIVAKKDVVADLEKLQVGELPEGLFDRAMEVNTRDLSRSLQSLWSSDLARSFFKHRDILEPLNEDGAPGLDVHSTSPTTAAPSSPPLTAAENAQQRDETINQIRRAYNSDTKLKLTRNLDVSAPFHYMVMVMDDSAQLGWCRESSGELVFVDMSEKPVISVPAAVFFGDKVIRRTASSPNARDREDHASSGCCSSSSRSRAGSVANVPAAGGEEEWFIKVKGQVKGPVSNTTMQLWWRYHLLPEGTFVRLGSQNDFDMVKELPDKFSPITLLQLVDPTALNKMF